ncbi:hypothetical protein SPFM6_00305 [Salmonella phage SPFM6]|nr:hypothetical protein SPFM6_00305 [Salmonella phage SPFM6]
MGIIIPTALLQNHPRRNHPGFTRGEIPGVSGGFGNKFQTVNQVQLDERRLLGLVAEVHFGGCCPDDDSGVDIVFGSDVG